LQKVLAHAGVASRRAAEQMMLAGRVWVDGRPATTLGMRVDPQRSQIEVDGQRVHVSTDHEYILLNKPSGVVTTVRDPQGRPTVMDLIRSDRRVYPVGRLDADTQGVLLLTDDGELTHRMSHPRYEIPRTYLVEVRGLVPDAAVRRLVAGVRLEDGPARAKTAKVIRSASSRTQLELVLTEGRKREVRRMLESIGFPAVKLVRTRFGPLTLRGLKAGKTRLLTPQEVGELHKIVGL
jgi:23S rRNA pseudouridine2605 synthase